MNAVEIIETKRDRGKLSGEQIREFIHGFVRGDVADYQMASFLMAVYLNGMDPEETASLTSAMLDSGERVEFEAPDAVSVDKHSTGGVGDKITLPLAPLVASFGVPVPMLAGRGLGHTGGTLDKLESIPGFRTNLSLDEYREGVRKVGAVIMGQTKELAPADRKMYALRDVTGTVPSIPLITSSILSKKAAGGARALVLDVKCGAGAFMTDPERARNLARELIRIGTSLGLRVSGLLTRMEEPIGRFVGNALEVRESIEVLRGGGPEDTVELTVELGGMMLHLGGKAETVETGKEKIREAIRNGRGMEKIREMIRFQGGDEKVLDDPERLPSTTRIQSIRSSGEGHLTGLDARKVGLAALALGAGRKRVEDRIDPAVGIELLKKCGDEVRCGMLLARLYIGENSDVQTANRLFSEALRIEGACPDLSPLILERIESEE